MNKASDLQPTEEALYVPDCNRSGNVQSRLASYIGCHHTYVRESFGDFSPNSLVTTRLFLLAMLPKSAPSRCLLSLIEPQMSLTARRTQHQVFQFNHHQARYKNAQVPQRHIGTRSTSNVKESTPRTHYTLFPLTFPAGPPPAGPFKVDLTRLKKEFLQLQSRAHPDLHQGNNKDRAEGISAAINDAYKTLQHPLLRAQYLLSLRGTEIADYVDDDSDQELIMDVLEIREAIEDAETPEEIAKLQGLNAERIRACVERLEELFAKDDLCGTRTEIGRLKYWCSIEEALREWDIGKNAD